MSNQTDFIRSVTVGLIFVPYHFVCDVARKIVFLRREKIEAWLLGSVCCSGAISLVTLVYYFFINKIYLFDGQFPLIVPVLTTAILFLIYAVFKGSVFKLYDDLQDFVFFDSILAEASNKEPVIQITNDTEETMQRITDEPEITEEPEITGEPDEVSQPVKLEKKAQTVPLRDTFDLSNLPTDLTIGSITKDVDSTTKAAEDMAMAAIQASMQDTAAKTVDPSTVQAAMQLLSSEEKTSVPVKEVTTETLSATARKALYKNKMLAAIRGKLDTVKSAREFSEAELNKVCKTQEFILADDFTTVSLNIDIEDMLFGE